MSRRDVRLQAAVISDRKILVLRVRLDGGGGFWLLPGGGREAADTDEAATVVREVREETGATVVIERMLLDAAAHPDDATYRSYRTFLCRPVWHGQAVAGARDGFATIDDVRWLPLDDEGTWGTDITQDRFLTPQLRAIRDALSG